MQYLTKKEAASYLRICPNTLMKLDVPRFNSGRRVLFDPADLVKWVQRQKYRPPELVMPSIVPVLPRRTRTTQGRWSLRTQVRG